MRCEQMKSLAAAASPPAQQQQHSPPLAGTPRQHSGGTPPSRQQSGSPHQSTTPAGRAAASSADNLAPLSKTLPVPTLSPLPQPPAANNPPPNQTEFSRVVSDDLLGTLTPRSIVAGPGPRVLETKVREQKREAEPAEDQSYEIPGRRSCVPLIT